MDWATGTFWDKNSVFTAKDFAVLPKNPFCDDMRHLISTDLGQQNQLGDGAALVWLWRNDCWQGVKPRRAIWQAKGVRFEEVADNHCDCDTMHFQISPPELITAMSSSCRTRQTLMICASIVFPYADGRIYFLSERGQTTVLAAGERFEVLATNPLNEKCQASMAVSHQHLFIRTEKHLWCIGK